MVMLNNPVGRKSTKMTPTVEVAVPEDGDRHIEVRDMSKVSAVNQVRWQGCELWLRIDTIWILSQQ
jgi:hypothetical protein